jgi:two-component system, sensor histidine kinase PdtaS
LPIATDRPLLAGGVTLLLIVAGFVSRLVADGWLPPGFPYVTFFPAVLLASVLFGLRYGLAAGTVCGLLAWYFFIGERYSFALGPGAAVALGFYVFVVGVDILIIHWMQTANAKLAVERENNRALAQTRELLFNELQHRVSNNLQVAAGLISLQKRQVSDRYARDALDEASRRLAVIGRISRQLYDAGGNARRLRDFLEPLCHDVIEASGRSDIACDVRVEDDSLLRPDAAIPMALIVAEALANAIEHGFADGQAGTVIVEMARDEPGLMRIEVRDDGRGLPEGFDVDKSDSLGLRIARMLAEQLQGRFEMLPGSGATARLTLPG